MKCKRHRCVGSTPVVQVRGGHLNVAVAVLRGVDGDRVGMALDGVYCVIWLAQSRGQTLRRPPARVGRTFSRVGVACVSARMCKCSVTV